MHYYVECYVLLMLKINKINYYGVLKCKDDLYRQSISGYFRKWNISYRIENGNRDTRNFVLWRLSEDHYPIHSCMYAVFFKKTLRQK